MPVAFRLIDLHFCLTNCKDIVLNNSLNATVVRLFVKWDIVVSSNIRCILCIVLGGDFVDTIAKRNARLSKDCLRDVGRLPRVSRIVLSDGLMLC